MKQVTVFKISALPVLLSLLLWLSGAFPAKTPVSGPATADGASPTAGWNSTPAGNTRSPLVLGVDIFCSLGVHFALRFQESLQEHARTH